MRKTFRIVRNNLSEEVENAYHPLRYRVEQKYSLLFFYLWGSPDFSPPHNFTNYLDAIKTIWDKYPSAVIVDTFDEFIKRNPYFKKLFKEQKIK